MKSIEKKQYAKKYEKAYLEKLKNNIKIEDVVKKDFILKKYGKNYFTNCPFCAANKALCISEEKQIGHCFSCGETFDVFGYFYKVKKLTFKQSIIKVKRIINTNNNIELSKLLKASVYFKNFRQGKNYASGELIKSSILKSDSAIEIITKIDWILVFLISDYFRLDEDKYLLPEEVHECKKVVKQILNKGFFEEPIDTRQKLINLFEYVSEILDLIEDNNFNLSGIVYGLKRNNGVGS